MKICMLNWKQNKMRMSCTDWLSRETEQGKMYSHRLARKYRGTFELSNLIVIKKLFLEFLFLFFYF